ncbi:MAG TPA: hypothetical protein VIS48_15840 [Candidatus Kryptonia bacterium]
MRHLTRILGSVPRNGIWILLAAFASVAIAQERSDFEIVNSFQTKYKAIKEAVTRVQTVQECAEVSANIDELEKEFAADTVLLNKALYPDKYDDQITEVRVELRISQDKLGLLESAVARIADLESQVRALSGKVDSLSNENSKLMASMDVMSKALNKNSQLIDSLNGVIKRLRSGLAARDAAIFAMVDSMFMQYDKNIEGLPDQQKKMLLGKMEHHNVVANIMEAAEQNTKFLESTKLSGSDLAQMIKEQKQFSSYWKGLGPKLANVYINAKDRSKQVAAIDAAVANWGVKADSALWTGLNAEFVNNQIPVKPFNSGDEFMISLGTYLDTQGGDMAATDAQKAEKFKHFMNDVWTPSVGSNWVPLLVDAGYITKDQQNQLQSKLDAWQAATGPSHAYIYIIVAVVIILIVIVVMVMRRKKPKTVQPQA